MSKNIKSVFFIVAIIVIFISTLMNMIFEENISFFTIVQLAILLVIFFSYFTWSQSDQDDKVKPDEEMGQEITKTSALISYKLFTIVIFGLIVVDKYLEIETSILLVIVFAVSLILIPITEYFVSKRYK
ncbi:hypothetical protein [Exiguobacterium sp. s131]|uniref:hypothetical protein n=1 Tax=Exiguobacterium sp. s131 TaxID=2751278 RepID=UPI001BEA4516|nr:hypothetical protein [Exiguobacterium sp. s131]